MKKKVKNEVKVSNMAHKRLENFYKKAHDEHMKAHKYADLPTFVKYAYHMFVSSAQTEKGRLLTKKEKEEEYINAVLISDKLEGQGKKDREFEKELKKYGLSNE